jgi:hypothetical protein
MSSSTSDLQFDDLADRLRRLSVSEKCTEGEIAIIMDMTLEDPRLEKVTFGKAHVGKTFQEMVTETKYLTWFTETFRHSRKPEHVKLLRFVQLHLEQLERNPVNPNRNVTMPKAKAKMPPHAPPMTIDLELEEDETSWDQVHEDGELMQLHLQDRMNQMEMVMQEVLGHLRRTATEEPN